MLAALIEILKQGLQPPVAISLRQIFPYYRSWQYVTTETCATALLLCYDSLCLWKFNTFNGDKSVIHLS